MTAKVLTDNHRLGFTQAMAGAYYSRFEFGLFNEMVRATNDAYSGGYWDYLMIEGGGGYARVRTEERFTLHSLNGWSGEMSADAAGICVTLTILSRLSFDAYADNRHSDCEKISNNFHALREWSYGHTESEAIVAFCD